MASINYKSLEAATTRISEHFRMYTLLMIILYSSVCETSKHDYTYNIGGVMSSELTVKHFTTIIQVSCFSVWLMRILLGFRFKDSIFVESNFLLLLYYVIGINFLLVNEHFWVRKLELFVSKISKQMYNISWEGIKGLKGVI